MAVSKLATTIVFMTAWVFEARHCPTLLNEIKKTKLQFTLRPSHVLYILLAVVGPFSSLHSKPCLSSPVNVTPLFIIQSCGWAFFFAHFLRLHCTEHTLCLALDVGCKRGQAMCVRFRSCHFTRTYNTFGFL